MTLTNNGLHSHMHYNYFSMDHPSSSPKSFYYVREPHGKRSATANEETCEYAPKAKKRFERVNTMLNEFSISNDKAFIMESSSDEDMGENEVSNPVSPAIVEEPEDNSPTYIELDDTLRGYLEKLKDKPILPAVSTKICGNEVAVWKPMKSLNPFDDPTMVGRICELPNESEDDEVLELEQDSANISTPSTSDEEMSATSSPYHSPRVVELTDDDLSQCSEESDEMMDMEY